jgi:RNA polymerase sporulation-specific sigma factor
MKYQYNDNELLYLMYENVDEAMGIMFKKYSSLINKRISTFRIANKNREDFFQEGLIALNTALNTFNPFLSKTFNKYFDLLLQRRFMNVLSKQKNYFYNVRLVEDLNIIISDNLAVYDPKPLPVKLTKKEEALYTLRFVKRYKCMEIATILNWNIKKVYNEIYALKIKLKED